MSAPVTYSSCHLLRGTSGRRGDRAVRVGAGVRRTTPPSDPLEPARAGLLPAGGAGAALVSRRPLARQLAADNRIGRSTPSRSLHEGIDALAARAPGLRGALLAARCRTLPR